MILYLGTSTLVKLYVTEQYSDVLREWVGNAEIISTCKIAYAEVMSALDVRFRKNELSKSDYEAIVGRFSRDWRYIAKVDFNDFEAGTLIKKYGLTRFGAIHLSAAIMIADAQKELLPAFRALYGGTQKLSLFFSSEDKKLCSAASSEGLTLLPLG